MAVTVEIINANGVETGKLEEAKAAAQKAANAYGCEVEIITRDADENPLVRISALPE